MNKVEFLQTSEGVRVRINGTELHPVRNFSSHIEAGGLRSITLQLDDVQVEEVDWMPSRDEDLPF